MGVEPDGVSALVNKIQCTNFREGIKMKKVLAFTLTVTLSLSTLLGAFTVADAKNVSDLPKVPLNYMDNDSDWKAATGTTHASPVVFKGTVSKDNFDGTTRMVGGNAQDPISAANAVDDYYFKLENKPLAKQLDGYIEIFSERSNPGTNRIELKPGEENVITVSMDIAIPNARAGNDKNIFAPETSAKVNTYYENKWETAVAVKTNGTFGTGEINDNTWYNVTYEIGNAENEKAVTYFLDGVKVGEQTLTNSNLGLIRTGAQSKVNADTGTIHINTICYDNVYVNVGEPYTTARYLANKDAAALNFTHFKGENTAKDAITSNLNLANIDGMDENTSITWQSDSAAIDAETGKITPAVTDTPVTLTATITNDGKSNTKTFALVVAAKQASDEEVEAAKAGLRTVIDANADKAESAFIADSFASFTAAKAAAQAAYDKPDATVTELVAAKEALTRAVDGLNMPGETMTGAITNDAFTKVNDNNASDKNGETIVVKAGNHPTSGTRRMGYIGVDISNISPAAVNVVLKLYYLGGTKDNQISPDESINANAIPISFYETSAFDETTLVYNNRPAVGDLITSTDCEELKSGAGWLTVDLTDYTLQEKAKGKSEIWLAFTTADADNISNQFYSKDAADETKRPVFEGQNINLGRSKQADLNAIDIQALLGDGDSINSVTGDLKALPETGSMYQHAITWTSSNETIINPETGAVVLPDETTTVTLTASVNEDGVVHQREFPLTVKVFSDTEAEANALTFDTMKGANTAETAITSNLNLVTTGAHGSAIRWASSDEAVIAADGTVVRDALANAKDVTLTATVGTGDDAVTKAFHLRVFGDQYISDFADKTVPYEISDGLDVSIEQTWRLKGYTHTQNGNKGQYVIYRAGEGFDFKVAATQASAQITFFTSDDAQTWKPFTDFEVTDSNREIGYEGGHNDRVYTTTQTLPAGTRYLKVCIPDTDKAWQHRLMSVEIFKNNEKVTFDNIKNQNYSSDAITGNLTLPTENITWQSSNPDVITAAGELKARPAADTPVTLTATITDGGVTTVKAYHLTAKAPTARLTAADIPFVYYRNAKGIAAMNNGRGVGKESVLYSSVDFVNLTGAAKDAAMAIVVYDTAGRLLDVHYEKVTIDDITGTPQNKTVQVTLGNETENIYSKCTIKAFAWDATGLFPVCGGYAVTLNK